MKRKLACIVYSYINSNLCFRDAVKWYTFMVWLLDDDRRRLLKVRVSDSPTEWGCKLLTMQHCYLRRERKKNTALMGGHFDLEIQIKGAVKGVMLLGACNK